MERPVILNKKFHKEQILPVFEALGWLEKHRIQDDALETIVIEQVVDHTLKMFPDVPDELVVLIIDRVIAIDDWRTKVRREGERSAHRDPLVIHFPSGLFFTHVRPFFVDLGWCVHYELEESHDITINSVIMSNGERADREVAKCMINTSIPHHRVNAPSDVSDSFEAGVTVRYDLEDEELRGAFQSSPGDSSQNYGVSRQTREASDSDNSSVPPAPAPGFDFAELSKNPTNEERLKEYAERMITVDSDDMIRIVKDGFGALGYSYGGTHYGNKKVTFTIVVSEANGAVIGVNEVEAALLNLGVKYSAKGGPVKIPIEKEEEEEIEEEATTAASADFVPEISYDEDALQGGLVLGETEKLSLVATYCHERGQVNLELGIGQNTVVVHCLPRQATDFLATCSAALDPILHQFKDAGLTPANWRFT